jgi:hypothetical protein
MAEWSEVYGAAIGKLNFTLVSCIMLKLETGWGP